MLEIIYRIYEVCEHKQENDMYGFDRDCRKIIAQDVLICESRQKFKDIVLDMYADEPNPLRFRASRNYDVGQKYCVIISEQCYNTGAQTSISTCACSHCGVEFQGLSSYLIRISDSAIKFSLGAQYNKYKDLRFCSEKCRDYAEEKAKRELHEELDLPEEFDGWISKDNLTSDSAGFIYKISKRSTGEFYVGQSVYVPVFRWGQHLKTTRFPLSQIEDYIFEIIESVEKIEDLNDREKHWIQKLYLDSPELSLNIALTKNIEQDENQLQIEAATA